MYQIVQPERVPGRLAVAVVSHNQNLREVLVVAPAVTLEVALERIADVAGVDLTWTGPKRVRVGYRRQDDHSQYHNGCLKVKGQCCTETGRNGA